VGNITVGGTGKTSFVRLLLDRLSEDGLESVVLCRGYKRKSRGLMVLRCGDQDATDPALYGDEPLMISRSRENCALYISEDRYRAGLEAMKEVQPDVFILDDGFQHVSLRRDLDILLVDCTNPFDNGRILPFGLLREPLSAIERAHLVVLTRSNQSDLVDSTEELIGGMAPHVPVLKAVHEPHLILTADGREAELEELRGKPVYLFSGIGNHASFCLSALECGARIAEHRLFPDHHWYTKQELADLARACRTIGAEWLLTTEKDMVRIPPQALPESLHALTVNMSIESGADILCRKIHEVVHSSSCT
jgi:tetraacyldisaccharide 4'-kinase